MLRLLCLRTYYCINYCIHYTLYKLMCTLVLFVWGGWERPTVITVDCMFIIGAKVHRLYGDVGSIQLRRRRQTETVWPSTLNNSLDHINTLSHVLSLSEFINVIICTILCHDRWFCMQSTGKVHCLCPSLILHSSGKPAIGLYRNSSMRQTWLQNWRLLTDKCMSVFLLITSLQTKY